MIVFTISNAFGEPVLFDQNFKVEKLVTGMNFPVQMDFVGEDLLVLEKSGDVRLVRDGALQDEPVLHVDVVNIGHDGLLGITHVEDIVFLYMTQETDDPKEPSVNRIYKYKWNGEKLIDPILVNELPGNPRHDHAGGVMVTDLEDNVFTIIGDLFREGLLQHFEGEPDDSSMVLRVGLDESVTRPYLTENPFDHYYGIGIRNSFGLTIDPVTGYLWQTENGPENFDEINLIRPGFDGGWKSIRGPATEGQIQNLSEIEGYTYSNPEFSWETTVAPTGLTFMDSEQFREYHDTLFVADFNTGSIFKFELNDKRNGFVFTNPELGDLVANPGDSIREMMFGTGFGAIIDIKKGPDGALYLISFDEGSHIYRIFSNNRANPDMSPKKLQDSGLSIEEIRCDQGFILVTKKSDGIATCLKPSSTVKLIERNWALPLTNSSNICNNPPSSGVNWTKCNFSFSDLNGVHMESSNLLDTNLVGANFKNSFLSKADLSKSDLVFSNFSNSDLSNSVMVKSKAFHTDFSNAILTNSNLLKSVFSFSNFYEADLSGSQMQENFLTFTNLTNANLSYANITKSQLPDAILTGADLTGADISNSNLVRVDFSEADLSDANLSDSRLAGANFSSANLTNADLSNTNLQYTIFTDTIFNNTILEGCEKNPVCDQSKPIVTITNPPEGNIDHIGDIVIEGTASDESGIEIVDAFAHTLPFDGEFNFQPAMPSSPGDWSKWSISITIPDEQTYRVLVRAIDNNRNPNWDEIMINAQLDTIEPEITITSPKSSTSIINYVGDIVIEGTASDESGIAIVDAFAHTLPHDGEFSFQPATPSSPGDWSKWSINITIPDEQPYRVLVRVMDNNGNPNWVETMINNESEN